MIPSLRDLILIRLADMDVGPIKAAQDAGLGRDYIRDIISGKKRRVLDVNGLARALGVDPVALADGRLVVTSEPEEDGGSEPAQPRRVSTTEEWEEDQKASQDREAADNRAYWTDPMNWRERYRPTLPGMSPEIDMKAGAGEGEVGEIVQLALGGESYSGHKIIGEWLFPEEYLRAEINASPSQTLVMPVRGDSMEPTYRPGDRVLVDLSQKTITEDTVYVISDGRSAPRIKRLVEVFLSEPRLVNIVSDNPAIAAQQVALSDLTIIGRVVGVVSRR